MASIIAGLGRPLVGGSLIIKCSQLMTFGTSCLWMAQAVAPARNGGEDPLPEGAYEGTAPSPVCPYLRTHRRNGSPLGSLNRQVKNRISRDDPQSTRMLHFCNTRKRRARRQAQCRRPERACDPAIVAGRMGLPSRGSGVTRQARRAHGKTKCAAAMLVVAARKICPQVDAAAFFALQRRGRHQPGHAKHVLQLPAGATS